MHDRLLERLSGVKADGEGWSAKCPAHDDRRSSLSVARGSDGRWLLHCHAGCSIESILAALGLNSADLFPQKTTPKTQIIAEYQYLDEGGAHLFDVVRFEPKDFRQRRADGVWSMKGVRRVLYRLPDLQGKTQVYVVEGEKDADHLRLRGLTATTCPGGAGKWTSQYTQQLKAAAIERVVVLPDNDEPGRQHAEAVARSCHDAGLQVKVVNLPGLPAKGDVSDWLTIPSRGKEDLHALVKATALYEPTRPDAPEASAPTRVPIVTFLHTVSPEKVDWVWPSRLARGKYTLIAGEPGIGKTHLMTDATARITRIGRWPDGTPAPSGRVLWLTAEDGLADTLRPRIDDAGGDPSRVAVLEAVREADGTRSALSLVRDLDILAAAIRDVRPTLVIVDPITAYLGQVDTHRDAEVRSALAPVLDLIAQHQCALGAIGHLSKDAQRAALHRPGGSIAFVAAARLVLALAADPMDPKRRLLAPLKSNICKPAPVLAYRIGDVGLTWEADAVADVDVEAMFRGASPAEQQERSDAESVLTDLLTSVSVWPIDARDAIQAGQAHGIHERTLQRTARRMGFRISRQGFGRGGRWVWERPIPDTIADTSVSAPSVSPMSSMANPSGIYTNNNIDDTKSAFTRAREDRAHEEVTDGVF